MKHLLVHGSSSASQQEDSGLATSGTEGFRRLTPFSLSRSLARRLPNRSSSRGRHSSRSIYTTSYGGSTWHRHFKEGM